MVTAVRVKPAVACLVAIIAIAVVCFAAGPAARADNWFSALDDEAQTSFAPPAADDGELLASEPFLSAPVAVPRWSARLGAVILQRARPHSDVLLYNGITGDTVQNPDSLVFPFQGGVDAGLVWRGALADLEVRYFGVEDWSSSTGSVVSGPITVLNIPGVEPIDEPVASALAGHSSLQSVEFNVRRNVAPRFTWLAGFRYVSFRDSMDLLIGLPPVATSRLATFGATNQLFGAQVGADAILWQPGPRFRIESAIKAGVYANGAGSTLTAADDVDGEFQIRLHRDHTAFVGDLNFVAVYQLNRKWALRGGYQMLWLSGVAAGTSQFHNMNFATGQLSTNTSATIFFHGALVGLERSW